ncbi:MAG: T9SS type A sorting domain-containing protein [Bacteroidota bacterium]
MVLAGVAGSARAQGAAIYVSPSGDDAAAGDRDTPLRSFEVAFGRADAGDTVRLLPGRYTGTHRLRGGGGTADRPVVVIADTPGSAVIDGARAPGLDQPARCLTIEDTRGVVVQELVFENCWTDVVRIDRSGYVTFAGNVFRGGRRAIEPRGGTHHVLVEGNTFEQDERVWTTWAWDDLHHGENEPLAHFNGALLHPNDSDGGHVMRGNTIRNVFNGFRTKPSRAREDTNIEVTDNLFVNVRDNAIEPEVHVWNHHYARNRFVNSRKSFSIDEVRGGAVYIWGNVQWQEAAPVLGPSTQGGGRQRISGLWKFQESPLADTVWVFNNSFYTEAGVFKDLRAPFPNLRHTNNAYAFIGSGRWRMDHWDDSFAVDHDCANDDPPQAARDAGQAANAVRTDVLFADGLAGDLTLRTDSPCRDAGAALRLPAFGWTQPFEGAAPDAGAFEGAAPVEGPPFRYRTPPGGDLYAERPRITQHRLEGDRLTLHLSAPLDAATVSAEALTVLSGSVSVGVGALALSVDGYTLDVALDAPVVEDGLAIAFDPVPVGMSGEPFTHWASTVGYAAAVAPPVDREPTPDAVPALTVSLVPNPAVRQARLVLSAPAAGAVEVGVYDLTGRRVGGASARAGAREVPLDVGRLAAGLYVVRVRAGETVATHRLTVLPSRP